MITSGQVLPSDTSDTNATTAGQSLTMFVTELMSAAGTSPIQSIFTPAGAVALIKDAVQHV